MQAAVAIASSTVPSKDAFLTTMQVATMQQTVVAQKVQAIATAVAQAVADGGDITAAVATAEESLAEVQGIKLMSMIEHTEVNTKALDDLSALPLDDTSGEESTQTTLEAGVATSEGKKKATIALGVGLGVGLGVAALVGAAAGLYIIKMRRGPQEVAPTTSAA